MTKSADIETLTPLPPFTPTLRAEQIAAAAIIDGKKMPALSTPTETAVVGD